MKVEETKTKISSAEQYPDKIEPYLRDLINYRNTSESGEWMIQLNMHTFFAHSFISAKGTRETRNMNILSDNEKIMQDYETDDVINNLFISLALFRMGGQKAPLPHQFFPFNFYKGRN